MTDAENLRNVFKINLNTLIREKGITQKDLAEFMQVHPSTVNEWVKGKKIPRMDKIDKLCAYFLVKRSDLLEPYSADESKITVQLDKEERKLVEGFNSLSADGKNMILTMIQSLCVTHSAAV